MTMAATQDNVRGLPAYALFAALLAAAGLPIYIHAPKFYVDEYGVSLAALGAVLFGLRLLDVVQDPALGRLSQTLRHHRAAAVAVGVAVMAAGDLARPADVSPSAHDEPLLAEGRVHYAGQPVFVVAATSHRAARVAARRAPLRIAPLPAILTVDEAPAAQRSARQGAPVASTR